MSSSMKPGDIIGGKYRLTQEIGAGAMGSVWSGEDVTTGLAVALKLILHPTREHRTRLLREAKACGSLSHPNIVKLHDVGETAEGEPFLVLELLSGETLGEMVKAKRRLEPHVAARITRDIASALDVAHKARFIHRDLKPANIFLHRAPGMTEGQFVVKVLDFGVSKDLGDKDGPATATGAAVGSPAYMSPEQVCVRKDIDHRTDIWSLGIVLYELLTGVRPFNGSVDQVVRQILMADIPPASTRVRSVPPELDDIIARCLERDRGKRFPHAADLVRILEPLSETSRSVRVQLNVPTAPSSSSGGSAIWTPPDSTVPMASSPRAPRGSSPGAGDVRVVSTVPMHNAQRPNASPTGTQLLKPTDPVADPFAALRRERQQALAAYRQSSPALEDVVHGGTMAIPADLMMRAASGTDAAPGLPTSTSGSVHPAPPVSVTANDARDVRRKRRGSGVIFASVGVGVAAALALVVVLAISFSSSESGAATVTPPASPPPTPTPKPMPADALNQAPATTPVPGPMLAEPKAPAVPVVVPAAKPSQPTASIAGPKSTSSVKPYPACTEQLKTNCVWAKPVDTAAKPMQAPRSSLFDVPGAKPVATVTTTTSTASGTTVKTRLFGPR